MTTSAFFSGFLTSLAIIVPIGAQNAFVLKLGLMRQHVLLIALLCGFMDAALILLGVTFTGATFGQYGWALLAVKYISVQFKPYQYDSAAGAITASFIWFLSLGFGARLLRPLFAKARTWMILEVLIGVLMWSIAYHIWFLPLNML